MITKVLAIAAIKADAYCTSTFDENGVETVTYEDGVTPIDESLVDAKVKELEAIQAYQSKRVAEYPKIEEQLDKIYHSGIDASALKFGAATKVQATNTGAVVTGILTATSFSGTLAASNLTGALPAISGANLTNLPPSAPVGGASTNTVFFENDKAVAVNYQITSTKNAMSAGPISINAGIAVTVPSGCSWTIV